jgi:hypothetical protein
MTRGAKQSSNVAYRSTKQGLAPVVESAPGSDYVVVELRYESPVAYAPTGFAGGDGGAPESQSLNEALSHFDIHSIRSHFGVKAPAIRERVALAAELPKEPSAKLLARRGAGSEFRESGFVQIVPKRPSDVQELVEALKRKKAVWTVYAAPRPVPAGLVGSAVGSRSFEPAQGYLGSPPDGLGALEGSSLKGARGKGVTVCDIEGAWNLKHEDLPAGIRHLGGTMLADVGWRNHGTAVLGEMVSVPNNKGTVGICPDAKAAVQSAFIDGVFNLAAALTNATTKLKAGDVILIELQAPGPNDKYVAMQFWPDIFTAIVAATAKGITVVEAAGNGDENFDLSVFSGTGLQKDSGAIVVGAGVPPMNHQDFDGGYASLGVPRSRIFFSNYGKIVNVQAWGWHVATLAYGDAQGGSSENTWYTLRFSGTSSASPMVTGSVACLQGRALAKRGAPLPPVKVRKILMSTGTPQVAGPSVPVTQRIGPQPDLVRALARV